MRKVTNMSVESIVQRAALTLHTTDRSLFKPLVSISVIPASESCTLHLLAVSQSGGCGLGMVMGWNNFCAKKSTVNLAAFSLLVI